MGVLTTPFFLPSGNRFIPLALHSLKKGYVRRGKAPGPHLWRSCYWEREMAYSICRIAKLKNGGAITASEKHTLRQRETPNADLRKENERFIGPPPSSSSPTLEQEVFTRIGEQKIRKDAVLCVEILLTASPEYFRPDEQGRAGKWDVAQLIDWKQANHQWLSEEFGDRVVRAELHLDEVTPHIHAYLVPLDEKGKLNCKSIFGGREKLSKFQDSYAHAMAPLGLERGIKGSRATHTQIKDYYAAVTREPDLTLSQEEIYQQLADRQRVLKENVELERTAKGLVQEKEQLVQRLQTLQIEVEAQQQQALTWRAKYQALTTGLRELPLAQVAHELGLDPDSKDKHKWRNEDHTINITGSKFYDFKELKGGGGAIDLVMYLERCNFKEAIQWLHDHFGESATLQTVTRQTQEVVAERPQQPFIPPEVAEDNWQQVRTYLTNSRCLPSKLVDQLHQEGLVYADAHQNAVFLRRSFAGKITGASLRGTTEQNNSFKGLASGTRRSQGWFYTIAGGREQDPIQRAVLTESAIDVLSYQTLYPLEEKTLYLSTDGAGYVPLEQLKSRSKVMIAFDQDQAGEEVATKLRQDLPQAKRHTPSAKDWNQDLQDYFRKLQQQIEVQQGIKQQPQQRRNGPQL